MHSSSADILRALGGSDKSCVRRIGRGEVLAQLRDIKSHQEVMETGFVNIGLSRREAEPIQTVGRCFWVPASVRLSMR